METEMKGATEMYYSDNDGIGLKVFDKEDINNLLDVIDVLTSSLAGRVPETQIDDIVKEVVKGTMSWWDDVVEDFLYNLKANQMIPYGMLIFSYPYILNEEYKEGNVTTVLLYDENERSNGNVPRNLQDV